MENREITRGQAVHAGNELHGPPSNRSRWIRRGLRLSAISVFWNVLEGIVALAAGVAAGSVALIGFGVDSFVETASAAVVWWRFSYEAGGKPQEKTERAELWAARSAGTLLLILAVYLTLEAGRRLLGYGREPGSSGIGILLTSVSVIFMPLLARAKWKASAALQSKALRADSYETITCAWLSATTLSGLALNAALGWWWADPLAALGIVPLIVREGWEGLSGDKD